MTTTFALMPQGLSFFGFRNTPNGGGFAISSSPSSLILQAGSSSTVTLTLVSTNGLDATVSMSASINSGSQNSLTAKLNQATVSIKPGAPGTNYLQITATTAASGRYNATVSATSGSISHSLSIPITITSPSPDFAISTNPSSIQASQTTTLTLSVASFWGFAGNVSLSSSVTPQVSGGPTVSFANNSLTVSPTKHPSTTVTVSIGTSTVSGNYTIGLYGSSGQLHRSIFIPLTIQSSIVESLNLEGYFFSSGSNVTAYLRNTGNVAVQFTAYYVVDASGDQYSNVAWNGPSINVLAVGALNVLIPPDCSSCVRVGSAFNFTGGNSYTIVFVTSRSNTFTYTVTYAVRESLGYDSYAFPSNMSVTLYIRNLGTTSVNFVSYSVTDSKGDVYSLTSWSGPTINPNQVVAITFYIGTSCSGCTLSGSPFNFTINSPYTVTVVTGRGNQFWFQV